MRAEPLETRKGVGSPGIGVTDSCELPYRFWELNLGSMEEQVSVLSYLSSP